MSLFPQAGHVLNFDTVCTIFWSFPSGSVIKNLSAMQETLVQSLGLEDPLEKEMATHSSIPAWRIPWTEEPGSLYSPWGHKELDTTELLHFTWETCVRNHGAEINMDLFSYFKAYNHIKA